MKEPGALRHLSSTMVRLKPANGAWKRDLLGTFAWVKVAMSQEESSPPPRSRPSSISQPSRIGYQEVEQNQMYFHRGNLTFTSMSQGLNESWVFRCHELHSFGLQIIFKCISIATWPKVANDQKGTLYQNLPCWDLQKRFKSHRFTDSSCSICHISESTGCFFLHWYPT